MFENIETVFEKPIISIGREERLIVKNVDRVIITGCIFNIYTKESLIGLICRGTTRKLNYITPFTVPIVTPWNGDMYSIGKYGCLYDGKKHIKISPYKQLQY